MFAVDGCLDSQDAALNVLLRISQRLLEQLQLVERLGQSWSRCTRAQQDTARHDRQIRELVAADLLI